MENEPIRDPRLQELMESCRPGKDDLADPEMAPLVRELAASTELARLYERLKRFDAALADAFRDVPVPEGLESRILARLEAESATSRVPSPEPIAEGSGRDVGGRSAARESGTSRRRWLLAFGGLAATAVAVLVLVFGLLERTKPISKSDLLAGAIECFLMEQTDGGQLVDPATWSRPLSTTLLGVVSSRITVIRWRPLASFLGHSADAYDLVGPDGRLATVYAGQVSVDGLPNDVPLRPMHSTGETSASAWQEGDVVYVLVVPGGDRAYERIFGAAAGPLT